MPGGGGGMPGGMPGAQHLKDDPRIAAILKRLHGRGRPVAAICAAPMVLASAGLLEGRRATSFPGFLDGAAGFAHIAIGAFASFLKYAKLRALTLRGTE